MLTIVENRITFEFTRDGTVHEQPEFRIESTSHEAQFILKKIVPQVLDFIEFLIWKYRKEFKKLES